MAKLKTNLFNKYAVDSGKEENGVWHDFEGGIKIKVRRLSSNASQAARREAEKPYAPQLKEKVVAPEIYEAILLQQMAYGIIADWDGLEVEKEKDGKPVLDKDGNPEFEALKYTPESALEIISDEAMKDFRGQILQLSVQIDHYKVAADTAALGN